MATSAVKVSTAEELYSKGMERLAAGDLDMACWDLSCAAYEAADAYAERRGLTRGNGVRYEDIVLARADELDDEGFVIKWGATSMLWAYSESWDVRRFPKRWLRICAGQIRDVIDAFDVDR